MNTHSIWMKLLALAAAVLLVLAFAPIIRQQLNASAQAPKDWPAAILLLLAVAAGVGLMILWVR